ncbi:RelA/SpoT family protein [Streptomyces sp. NPDC059506]|uniref:RelA/SpoT family protein n=1 Tax=unclassified Streptomyces TaxID=2593676 RepID=UPI0015FD7517|nr:MULTISPECIES: HD domain-containing protein [unclassified Streptomyces]MCZ2527280.1 HD domain-containing protein [Streptomyces sp. HB2AG]QMV21464.1 HD domain-containing protein [Streptomyces sp. SCUT-3]
MSVETTHSAHRRLGLGKADLRRLGRAALRGGSRAGTPDALEHVVQAHRAHHPRAGAADLSALRRAYVLAEASHRGQMRKSGEPYITHPLAVTLILAQLGAETTTLVASLLHDTVEDTEVTLEQVREEFGEEVAYLVDGVTKLEKVDYGAAAEPETFRKMLVATGDDVRVMSIKLADRLHNMRTLGVMRREKQERIAKVTRDVLIPLAERLGVQAVKTELEDLVFAILHPEEYAATQEVLAAHEALTDPLEALAVQVRAVLRDAGIEAGVSVRPRHCVSVHRVRAKRGSEPGGYDFSRLLVVVEEDADCYAVLGELHTCFTPVIAEFKDFIAAPKFNLYQSLHTAVATDGGHVAEVLVRTHRMHRVAEAGVVALGNPYRAAEEPEAAEAEGERSDPTRPGWLSRLLAWQKEVPDADSFWRALRADLAEEGEITVFRADGGTLGLPRGATCVDAAYALGEEEGHRCVGARVNGRLTAMATVLTDGDTVHLLLAGEDGDNGPAPEWLEHATTPAARIAITRWLQNHPPEDRQAEKGAGRRPALRGPVPPRGEPAAGTAVLSGHPDAPVRLARCCTPVPPDEITGFLTRGGVVAVHRTGCSAAERMTGDGRSAVGVDWLRGADAGYRATLHAEALVRPRLLADVTAAIAGEGIAIVSATVEPPQDQLVRHTYTVELPGADALAGLLRAVRRVPGVYDVYRARRDAQTDTPD